MTSSLYRWHVKKAARKAVVLGSFASSSIAMRRLAGQPRVRAITYHRFGDLPHDPWWVRPAAFEEQMRWLADHRLAVSLDELLRFARGEIDLQTGSVLVTVDDGSSSMYTIAAPILKKYGIPAVAYVATYAVGNAAAGRGAGEPFLTWDQISALSDSGVEIGSHSLNHRSMASLTPEEIREEGMQSKALLEQRIGKPVTSFAYPFGMRRDESAMTEKILSGCGYRSIFISQHGTIQKGSNPLRLPRVKIEAGEPLWMFKLICQGGIDAWSLADRVL